ncbi:probable disease resistance protein At4g27220 isoform X3 [Vitis riparia]|uniref:probable disease resistance protein At4g27220 isoform X3 n=1 Tax=Vitis riparia TaxID=96939 RepID=UPI00155A72A3|nr:probable disease resistance protein At4g27220 isoform X3 [Vitis riparia]
MEPKKSETSQDLAGKSEIGLKSGPLAGKSEIGLKSGPLTGKSEIGTLAGKSEIGFLAGKSENIGTLARTSVIASKPGAFARTVFRLTGMARSKITDELEELNRKKDVVCLILSYPPFNSRNIETHRGWIRDVLEINHEVRKKNYGKLLSDPLMKYGVSVSDLSSKITGLLHHSIHDIEAHVPSHILVEMCEDVSLWYPTPKMAMLDLCIDDFMIRQILQNIQISEIRSILISGVNDKTFPRRLKNLPPIRQMFDLVIQVNVKSCMTVEHMQDRIIEELGFSKSSRGEAEQLLRSQNFLIFLDRFDPWIMDLDLHDLGNGWWNSDNTQKIVLMGYSGFSVVPVADLEIRGSHHLLSWELFCKNVGEVMSSIQQLAVHLLRQCSGHLLATVLMARALKDVKNVRIWQHASRVIGCLPTSHAEDRILFNALAFVLEHLGSANKCVKYCASHLEMEGTYKVDLLDSWMKEDLIKTLDEGKKIVQHLVNALLLESFQNGESIRMRKEIHKELVNFYEAEMNPILLVELDGRGLMEAPKNETWEEANEMYLMNNKISKLLDNPNCPKLNALFLQEELVVEDCPEINTIMLPADQQNWRKRYLPNLKKISLHYLPKLVSIFGNVPIAPSLEWLSFYDCPSLKILFPEEVSSHKLKVIIGEVDWWSALNESERFQLQNLGAIFFPIERDIDLRTQLAEINDQLQAQMQKTEPSQQSGLDDSLENPAVEVETSSKQKQVA